MATKLITWILLLQFPLWAPAQEVGTSEQLYYYYDYYGPEDEESGLTEGFSFQLSSPEEGIFDTLYYAMWMDWYGYDFFDLSLCPERVRKVNVSLPKWEIFQRHRDCVEAVPIISLEINDNRLAFVAAGPEDTLRFEGSFSDSTIAGEFSLDRLSPNLGYFRRSFSSEAVFTKRSVENQAE